MNSQKSDLPEYCRLIDELITKIAEKHGRDAQEVKQAILTNIKATR